MLQGGIMKFREDFLSGAGDMAPLLPAGAIVGLVTGMAATAIGLSPIQTIAMAVLVYYPTVMLTAFLLLETGTPGVLVVVLSLLVDGGRGVLYSLSLAPYFSRFSTVWKWFLAYFLWTPVYAFSIERYTSEPTTSRRGYYLGTAVPLWIIVQLSVIAGVFFGRGVPPEWELEFVIPLAFIALLMRFIEDRPTKAAGVAGGVLAVAAAGVPMNLGILVAAIGGTTIGVVVSRWGRR
ncbi:AzlC family ABC transporter permease [Natronorarus salvus]|uniref:AzlC family ABC transporter permease n=1 Tax=Natronorarus salvus TaxID=3117733 RepID=UPI002F2645E3